MIEKYFISHELSLKRWRRFKRRPQAVLACWFLLVACFFSFTAEFWANSKPIILKYKGSYYFPVVKNYHPKVFGLEDQMVVNYRSLCEDESVSSIWPVIQWDPYESNEEVDEYPSAPSSENWMGTDDRGRDILTRLLYGLRYSITFAFCVWLLNATIGTVLGGVMGYLGGKVDFVGQRFVEILSTIPQFFLLIIIISIFKPSLILLILISSLFGWISLSYYIRGEFLKNRKKDFIEAARAQGAKGVRIFFNHILPNSLSPIITFAPFMLAGNIVSLAGLDYLGFGLTPPTPSWGELLNQAKSHFTTGWWLAFFPSLALFSTLVCLSLIGEGVRDAMDPYQN